VSIRHVSTPAALLGGLLVAGSAAARQTEVAVYNFGDVDAGAADGQFIHNPTVEIVGARHLSPIGEVRYTTDTPNPDNPFAAELGPGAYFSTHDLPTTLVEEFAIEVWAKPASTTGFQWIVYNGKPGENGYGIARDGDRYRGFAADLEVFGGPAVPGQWTQLAISQHWGRLKMWTNGSLWSWLNSPAPVAPQPGLDSAFTIGAGAGGVDPFEGLIDEVRVMIVDATHVSDFAPNLDGSGFHHLEPGLVRYHLGEADPGAVAGGVGRDPTVDSNGWLPLPRFGAPTYSGESCNPNFPLAMRFDGSGERYRTPVLPSTAVTNWGVEAWVKADTDVGFSWILYNGLPGVNGWGFAIATGTWTIYTGESARNGGNVVPGRWTHLALASSGGIIYNYTNGVRLSSGGTVYVPAAPGPSSGFAIGASPTGSAGFAGEVDQVRVFEFAPGAFDPLDPARHFNLRGVEEVPLDPPLFQDGFEGGHLLRWSSWLGWSP
jgi:hypothetical protein